MPWKELSAITSKECMEESKSLNESNSSWAGLEKMNTITAEQNQSPGKVDGTNDKSIEKQESRGSVRGKTSHSVWLRYWVLIEYEGDISRKVRWDQIREVLKWQAMEVITVSTGDTRVSKTGTVPSSHKCLHSSGGGWRLRDEGHR